MYLRIDGVQGEAHDTSREGTLLTWELSSDGFGTAQVVTDGPTLVRPDRLGL